MSWVDSVVDKVQTRAKDVFSKINRTQTPEISPAAATEWSSLLPHDVICSERVPFRRWGGLMGAHSAFVCPWGP